MRRLLCLIRGHHYRAVHIKNLDLHTTYRATVVTGGPLQIHETTCTRCGRKDPR